MDTRCSKLLRQGHDCGLQFRLRTLRPWRQAGHNDQSLQHSRCFLLPLSNTGLHCHAAILGDQGVHSKTESSVDQRLHEGLYLHHSLLLLPNHRLPARPVHQLCPGGRLAKTIRRHLADLLAGIALAYRRFSLVSWDHPVGFRAASPRLHLRSKLPALGRRT